MKEFSSFLTYLLQTHKYKFDMLPWVAQGDLEHSVEDDEGPLWNWRHKSTPSEHAYQSPILDTSSNASCDIQGVGSQVRMALSGDKELLKILA